MPPTPDKPKPDFVLFYSPQCKFCGTFISKLKTKQELLDKINVVDIDSQDAIPDEVDEIPCIYDGSALHKGKEAFKWLNEKMAEHLSAANDGCSYSFIDGNEEKVFSGYAFLEQRNGSYGMGQTPNEQNLGDPTRMLSINDNTNKNRTLDSLVASRSSELQNL
jgi:hypothetical protein